MRKRAVHILVIVCMAMVLCGCSVITITKALEKEKADRILLSAFLKPQHPKTIEDVPATRIEEKKEEAQIIETKAEENKELEDPTKTTEKEQSAEEKKDKTDSTRILEEEQPIDKEPEPMLSVKTESGIDMLIENRRQIPSPFDRPLTDTVAYIPSSREEKVEKRQIESVIDENDPTTYQIVQREQETETITAHPIQYITPSGDVRYMFLDGIWYEYKYSSGDVTLDEKDEELALLLLNMDGSYKDFEIEYIECTEFQGEDNITQYSYHVRYKKTSVLEKAPEDTEMLTVVGMEETRSTQVELVEEKVPVLMEETYQTGEFLYYGWQTLDGKVCYFDKNARKVTGSQVIQGVRYKFNEDGTLISRAGVQVSSENGEIDWKAVRAAGITSAYLRCAYRGLRSGTLLLDARLKENLAAAEDAGISTGLYLYSQATTVEEAIEEAHVILLLAKQYQIKEPLVLSLAFATEHRSGRADHLDREERTTLVHAFCKTVQNAGYTLMIQAEKGWMENSLNRTALSSYPLWLIQYNTKDMDAVPAQIWQYTTKGTIDGIEGFTGLFIICGR